VLRFADSGIIHHVSKGRLTRQELGWLLTQEAQGAADRLRRGVQVLKSKPPPAPEITSLPEPQDDSSAPPSGSGLGVEASLAALDDVMQMLSSLHAKPAINRGRRGRFDLAALLWEVAPEARVSIEPGSGTEVFGDEGEIRRMLHVLVGHGSGLGSAVTIKRDGDDVRVSVVLGPDSSATAETERAWLSRMAVRYGGRYDLEGGAETLTLPAEDAAARDERNALRKELDEARKQGELYAKELAAVFAQGEELAAVSQSSFPPVALSPNVERLALMSRFAGGVAAELRALLSPLGRELQGIRAQAQAGPGMSSRPPPPVGSAPPEDDRFESMRRRLVSVQDFLAALAAVGELDPGEPSIEIDLVELAKTVVRGLDARIERQGVEVDVEGPSSARGAMVRAAPRAVAVLLRELASQAIGATTRAGRVRIAITERTQNLGARITVDDSGPALPASARRALLGLELDPGTYGRSSAVPLYVAAEIAAWQGGLLELGDAPVAGSAGGGLRVTVTFPR
jgi:signal transduction histidine kinase